MAFVPSVYQQQFFDWIKTGTGSAILVAVAGSGKSTSIQESLCLIPESAHVQVFVFNHDIADDWKARLKRLAEREQRPFANFRTSTFHSVGMNAVTRYLKHKVSARIEPNSNKMRDIIADMLDRAADGDDGEVSLYQMYGSYCADLVSLAKGEGIGVLKPSTYEAWWELAHHHDLTLENENATEERAIEIARRAMGLSVAAANRGNIDFDDMLFMPLWWKLRLWQNDFIFVDEAQDSNPVRRAFARLALKPGGRLIAVGDPKQAIFGFTGASADALDQIKRDFAAIQLPLTVSYRCPKAVVEYTKKLVPYIEAAPGAKEGSVLYMAPDNAVKALGPHDAVLCRNTAPLITFAYKLIAQNVGCVVLGREIGVSLVKLVKAMQARGIDSLSEKLAVYANREVAKHMAAGEEQKAERILDKVSCIQVCIANLTENERTVPSLIKRIESLFSDTNGVLTLSTVHKAKGREWEKVAILEPDLMPSKYARQEWQVEQERHLQYVAWTRAMDTLIFIQGGA